MGEIRKPHDSETFSLANPKNFPNPKNFNQETQKTFLTKEIISIVSF